MSVSIGDYFFNNRQLFRPLRLMGLPVSSLSLFITAAYFQPFSSSHQCTISAKCGRDAAVTAFKIRMSTQDGDSGWSRHSLRVFVSGLLKYRLRYSFYLLDNI
jgi:hypothetical protein